MENQMKNKPKKPKSLKTLLKEAKTRTISDEERRLQRISFAYGNTKIENDRITREMVEAEAKKLNTKLVDEQ